MNVSELNKPPNGASPVNVSKAPPAVNRMSVTKAKKGIIECPHRVLIYGGEKCAKSSFAASAPDPIFMGRDDGTEHLDIARMPRPRNWKDVLAGVVSLIEEPHDFKTLVLDPVNWLEPMLHDEITEGTGQSIEAFDGGFQRGYDAAVVKWRVLLEMISRGIWKKRQMNVILVAHAKLTNFKDPSGLDWKRWGLAMANDRISDVFRQWVDSILFVKREAYGVVADAKTKRVKASGDGALIAHTQWNAGYDAGNRWDLDPQIPIGWSVYVDAVEEGKARQKKLRPEIDAMLLELDDAETNEKVKAYLKDPHISLTEIHNALSAKLGAKREQAANPTATETKNDNETDEEKDAA